MSIKITTDITPADVRDTYALMDAKYLKGGLLAVDTKASLANDSAERRVDRLYYVKDESKFYEWDETSTTHVEVSVSSAALTQVTKDVAVNTAEVKRLAAIADADVYTYRGAGLPTLPTEVFKGYYISVYNVDDDNNELTIIDTVLPTGTVFSLDNTDANSHIKVSAPQGQFIDGSATSVNVPADNLLFLIKTATGWQTGFSGVIPPSMARLMADIKLAFPSSGTPLTIQEIEAQLKDRLHTFASIQTEFKDQLHTETELETAGFLKELVYVGYLENTSKPANDAWIGNHFKMSESLTAQSATEAGRFVGMLIPCALAPLVKSVVLNGTNYPFLSYDYTSGDGINYKYIVVSSSMIPNISYTFSLDIGIKASTSGGDIGVKGDEPTEMFLGITDLDFPTSIVDVDPNDNTTAMIQPYINARFPIEDDENPDAHQEFKTTALKFIPPMLGYSDPDKQLGTIVEIKHGTYEQKHAPGYLGYVKDSIEIIAKTGDDESFIKGALWLNNIVVPSDGIGITSDEKKKTYGVQEYDGLDPNVTGGTDFLISFRAGFEGYAPENGTIRIALLNKGLDPNDPSSVYLKDVDGNPFLVERFYAKGEEFKYLDVTGIVTATGLKEFQCYVEHTFDIDNVIVTDRTEGQTGLVIQALTSTEKTGEALQQFELDTSSVINFSSHYLGVDRFTMDYLIEQNVPPRNVAAGSIFEQIDGFGLYTPSGITAGVVNKQLELETGGDFCLHKIFSAEETMMLRGKQVKVKTTMTNPQGDITVGIAKWEGKPDEFTSKIVTGRDQGATQFDANWEQTDSKIINVSVLGEHTDYATFTVPDDAINYAIIIYPPSAGTELHLKSFDISVVHPFVGHVLKAPTRVDELHYKASDRHKHLVQDVQGYYSLRYTIPDHEVPMPCGEIKDGKADITIDKTVNVITGSQASGGEGAIVFGKEGVATVESVVNMDSELADSVTTNVELWWAKVADDGSLLTISDSVLSTPIKGGTKNSIRRIPTFTISVKAGDKIVLRAKSDKVDGAYLSCLANTKPILDVFVKFDEFVSDSGDTPGTGVDLSGFSKVPSVRDVGIYNFFNKNRVEIPLVIPSDVTMSVLAIHRLDGSNVRPLDHDYLYDNSTDTMIFSFANHYTGQIILEFFA